MTTYHNKASSLYKENSFGVQMNLLKTKAIELCDKLNITQTIHPDNLNVQYEEVETFRRLLSRMEGLLSEIESVREDLREQRLEYKQLEKEKQELEVRSAHYHQRAKRLSHLFKETLLDDE
ncbi:hypothetical protein [Chrysiogenes arsenatis]|uniref:hypothetical protein n=1 Tax=Chrysiogenes arsenatis TaxID=309797 RepID=UPI000411135A|nr:hypothetical protein [Chrysiogenes arsenatis]